MLLIILFLITNTEIAKTSQINRVLNNHEIQVKSNTIVSKERNLGEIFKDIPKDILGIITSYSDSKLYWNCGRGILCSKPILSPHPTLSSNVFVNNLNDFLSFYAREERGEVKKHLDECLLERFRDSMSAFKTIDDKIGLTSCFALSNSFPGEEHGRYENEQKVINPIDISLKRDWFKWTKINIEEKVVFTLSSNQINNRNVRRAILYLIKRKEPLYVKPILYSHIEPKLLIYAILFSIIAIAFFIFTKVALVT